jgi:hypothetical protein
LRGNVNLNVNYRMISAIQPRQPVKVKVKNKSQQPNRDNQLRLKLMLK